MDSIKIISRITSRTPLELKEHANGVKYLIFPGFGDENVTHAFSTRLGGVSKGTFSSLNLSFTRGDDERNVAENYRLMAEAIGTSPDDIVCTYQTHTTNIRAVSELDKGKGVTRERDYRDVDGLITDEAGIALAVFAADCVPILFYDKKNHAIGAAHAGWRGSADNMAGQMIRAMNVMYGTQPEDLECAIGPSICGDCYEVGEDVATEVRRAVAKTSCVSCEGGACDAGTAYGEASSGTPDLKADPKGNDTVANVSGEAASGIHTESFSQKLSRILKQTDTNPIKPDALTETGSNMNMSEANEAGKNGMSCTKTGERDKSRTKVVEKKYLLDLHALNRLLLTSAGVKDENIFITDICTKCNPELLYSYRVMGNKRGSLAAFIGLKQ